MWVESRKLELNLLFKEHIVKTWENVTLQENRYSQELLRDSETKRINKLRKRQKREQQENDLMKDYLNKTNAWSQSIQVYMFSYLTKIILLTCSFSRTSKRVGLLKRCKIMMDTITL